MREREPRGLLQALCVDNAQGNVKVEHTAGVKALTDEQLDAAIAALQEMIAAGMGDLTKVVEGEVVSEAPGCRNRRDPDAGPGGRATRRKRPNRPRSRWSAACPAAARAPRAARIRSLLQNPLPLHWQ
jgi:hypothetical protein